MLRFKGGVANIPHDDKVYKGGEDAWTASPRLIAVADGVGGWATKGVDPGLFSKQLTKDIQRLFDESNAEGAKKLTLKEVLIEAVKLNKNTGSSTAVLASLEEPNVLKTTNLGDSGYIIYQAEIADDKITLKKLFRSQEQQYRFNFPYQCGTGCELPHKAFDNQHEVTAGKDFVVMGTDGLFDNLFDEDVEKCLYPYVAKAASEKQTAEQAFELKDPEAAANCMAKKAYSLSKERRYMSPFAQGALQAGKRYIGGKEDDITVIVSQIVRQ